MSASILSITDAGANGAKVTLARPHSWRSNDRIYLRGLDSPDFDESTPVSITVVDLDSFYAHGLPLRTFPDDGTHVAYVHELLHASLEARASTGRNDHRDHTWLQNTAGKDSVRREGR